MAVGQSDGLVGGLTRRRDPSPLPWFAAGAALALALLLAAIRTANATPYDPWLGLGAFALAFATPGILGGLAAASGCRSLFAAAGASCLILGFSAFSGVTLPLLIPAICFLLLAADSDRPRPSPARRLALRTSLLATVGGFLVVIVLVTIGALAAVLTIAAEVSGVVLWRGKDRRPGSGRRSAPRVRDILIAVVLPGLVLAAFGLLLATTETVCWTARETPTGTIYARVGTPAGTGPTEIPPGVSRFECDSGVYSMGGAAGSLALDGSAIALAALVARAAGEAGRRDL